MADLSRLSRLAALAILEKHGLVLNADLGLDIARELDRAFVDGFEYCQIISQVKQISREDEANAG